MKKLVNRCKDCGALTNRQLAIRCMQCHLKKVTRQKKYCPDCGSKVDRRATRCQACRLKNKDLHPRWNGGLPKCLDCGKQLTQYDAKRCNSCAHKGELAHQWNPNKEVFLYPRNWTPKLRKSVRIRDGLICKVCKITEQKHISAYKQILSVHHIDYNKNNCSEGNLITLCTSCHITTNTNRKYWEAKFKELLHGHS